MIQLHSLSWLQTNQQVRSVVHSYIELGSYTRMYSLSMHVPGKGKGEGSHYIYVYIIYYKYIDLEAS